MNRLSIQVFHGAGEIGGPIIVRGDHIFLQWTVWEGDQLLRRTIYLMTGHNMMSWGEWVCVRVGGGGGGSEGVEGESGWLFH